ncbi:alpha/beta fold hydrolase [Ornithinimicrobium pratense]|uniref:Alpha/beta hydrolase n=1 Tax=Ornithinimicrobium pratense TaxID=2593973 RepID=A0A5J6V5M7_9MICO|nr:alpha/beta hydrolase [Ornithinimicrobium pratense]QFG69280.1 alpha/beta hydrolase [Ornithinimicrobium pratense]
MTRALILLHGTRMSRRQWRPYEELLTGLPLVARDLPGHGERAGEEFTREAALATVEEAVAEARSIGDGKPVLAGHSLGGYLGAMWAAQHPHDLGALVLIGATADPAGPLTGLYRGFARALPYVDAERMARWMNVLFRRLGAKGEHAQLLPDGAAYAALPAAWELVMDECGPELLREVGCPVWMVNGQLDQMRIHVRRFAAATTDARVVTVPRATHLMPATHPEQVAAVLRKAVADAR